MVTLARVSELFVSPGSTLPLRRHTICHGPEPEIVVLKSTASPAQRTAPASGVAAVNSSKSTRAVRVTTPHSPATITV